MKKSKIKSLYISRCLLQTSINFDNIAIANEDCEIYCTKFENIIIFDKTPDFLLYELSLFDELEIVGMKKFIKGENPYFVLSKLSYLSQKANVFCIIMFNNDRSFVVGLNFVIDCHNDILFTMNETKHYFTDSMIPFKAFFIKNKERCNRNINKRIRIN